MREASAVGQGFSCFDLYIQYSGLGGTTTPRESTGLTRVLWVWGLTGFVDAGNHAAAGAKAGPSTSALTMVL